MLKKEYHPEVKLDVAEICKALSIKRSGIM